MKETKLAKSKKKTEEETVWQRLRKKLRRPRLDYQDREMICIGCITCVNQWYLVRDSHSVRYPVCRTTEKRSWSVSLQWYSCLNLSSEHLVGFCCDSCCAYSDTEVKVKRNTPKAKDYWYWFNCLFVGCSQLVSVHIIMFMLSPCFFPLNFDYNISNTLFL